MLLTLLTLVLYIAFGMGCAMVYWRYTDRGIYDALPLFKRRVAIVLYAVVGTLTLPLFVVWAWGVARMGHVMSD